MRRRGGVGFTTMNPDEEVDVVDAVGNTVSVTTKREAHEKGFLHKTAIGQVIDSSGKWLLVKQSKDRQDAGQYVSPVGGHVQSGESEEDALKREAEEEVGLTGNFAFEFVGRAVFDRHVIGRHENHMFVIFKIFSDVQPILNHESESYRYFTERELSDELRQHPELFGAALRFVIDSFFPHLNHEA